MDGIPFQWDPAEIMFIKRLLQYVLPEKLRNEICSKLFYLFVSSNEQTFAKKFYMNENHLKSLIKAGMYVGEHRYSHKWLGEIPKEDQEREISSTYQFLKRLYGHSPNKWVFSYPRKSKNAITISILKQYDCAIGLSADKGLVEIGKSDLYDLPRIDTNYFPFSKEAPINEWTRTVIK